jgi:hypothetical protein
MGLYMARWKLVRRRSFGAMEMQPTTERERPDGDLPDGDELDDDEYPEDVLGAGFRGEGIAQLYADDSAALAQWKERLTNYVDLQGTLDALRLRPSSEQPWPAADNAMLGYLKDRSAEIAEADGIEAAIAWLAVNSWFEGAIAERSRFIRLLDAD